MKCLAQSYCFSFVFLQYLTEASKLVAFLGHTGRRVVLGHTFNTQTLAKTDEQMKNV